MKRIVCLFVMFVVFAFGGSLYAGAEGSPLADEENETIADADAETEPTSPEKETDAPSEKEPQADLTGEIQGVLDKFKDDMDAQYGEKPWYDSVSAFWDKYVGYIVSGVVLLANIGAAIFGLKYGKQNIAKYFSWCKDTFIPWMTDSLEEALKQFKTFEENSEKRFAELTEKYAELTNALDEQNALKAETQKVIADMEAARAKDAEQALKQAKLLKRILSLVASQMAYISQSTGLNNETADQIRAKYDALIAVLDVESEDTKHE